MDKNQQSSDWGAENLTAAQKKYAAADVIHLHALRGKLDHMLEREARTGLADACFQFLPTRARLDAGGWSRSRCLLPLRGRGQSFQINSIGNDCPCGKYWFC